MTEQKLVERLIIAVGAIVLLMVVMTYMARGEDKKPDPKPLTDTAQIQVLKADSALKDAQIELAGLQQQWNQLQQQMQSLQDKGKTVQTKLAQAQKDDEAAVEAALKAAGLDPAKYELDHAKMVASPKAAPAPPTPSPEKK